MQIRVFTVDENGYIKILPKDFELLLNDAYSEGYNQNKLTIGFQEPRESSKDVVYPTWLEFIKWFETGKPKSDDDFIYWMGTTNIPADIAQKLGIKPKGEE